MKSGRRIGIIGICIAIFCTSFIVRAEETNIEKMIRQGNEFARSGDFAKADNTYHKILSQYKRGIQTPELAEALKWGGNVCVRNGHPVDALEFYLASLKVADRYGDTHNVGAALSNIGIVYGIFRDYEQAASYFERALPVAKKDGDKYITAVSYANLAAAYCEMGDRKKAKLYIDCQRKNPLPDSVLNAFYYLHNKGLYCRITGDHDCDIRFHREGLATLEGHREESEMKAVGYLEMAKAFDNIAQYDSAQFYLQKSLHFALNHNSVEYLQDIYDQFARHYRFTGISDSIYKYQTLYYSTSDSLFNSSRFNEAKYHVNQYETDVNNRHINRLHSVIITLSAMAFLIAAIVVILVVYNRKLKNAKSLLLRKNQELFRQAETTNIIIKEYIDKENRVDEQSKEDTTVNLNNDADTESEALENQNDKSANNLDLIVKIQEIMENLEIISDPDFSLAKLATLIGSNTTYVSAVINQTFNKNFKTFLTNIEYGKEPDD